MTTAERSDVGIYKIGPLGDDVKINAAMTVGFELLNVLWHLLAWTAWTPNRLHFINDDDRTVRDSLKPFIRFCEILMRNEQIRDTVHVNLSAGYREGFLQQHDQGRSLASAWSAGDDGNHVGPVVCKAKRLRVIQTRPETRPPDMMAIASKNPAKASSCKGSAIMPLMAPLPHPITHKSVT